MSTDSMFFVRPGQTVDWQPPRYKEMKLSGGPVFTIKIMTEGQRRELQEKISNAAMEDAQATRDGRESSRVDGLHQEVMVTYVTRISDVPGSALGMQGEDGDKTFTVSSPDKLLKAIYALPSNDGKALDNAIWNVQALIAGKAEKNSNSSPELPVTNPGGETTDAKIAKD